MFTVKYVRQEHRLAISLVAMTILLLFGPHSILAAAAQADLIIADVRMNRAKVNGSARLAMRHDPNPSASGVAAGDNVRVLVRSYETAAIGAEINARITHLPEREGDLFRKGDLIVEFDCRKIITEHRSAMAILQAQKAIYENQRQMQRYNAAGTLAVEQARFEMEKSLADVDGLDVRKSSCKIHAPFDGRVIEKSAQVHEMAQPNQPLLRLVNESKIELILMVPSAWRSRIADTSIFSVKIDETGGLHEARIVQATGAIDPVSQSARYIAEILNPAATVMPGMSGTAMFPLRGSAQ